MTERTERTERCDNYSSCKNTYTFLFSGYYHGVRYCDTCIEKQAEKCFKCRKTLGYVIVDGIDSNRNCPRLYCESCITKHKET